MSGLSLKLHFCMFETLQGNHNSLDFYNVLEYFPLIAKLYSQSLTQIKNVFACSNHSNLKSG
jgi:hypothetical protein